VRVLVCNYDTPFYRDLYRGWSVATRVETIHASSAGSKGAKVEAVFRNY
jgi:hypothetical protein